MAVVVRANTASSRLPRYVCQIVAWNTRRLLCSRISIVELLPVLQWRHTHFRRYMSCIGVEWPNCVWELRPSNITQSLALKGRIFWTVVREPSRLRWLGTLKFPVSGSISCRAGIAGQPAVNYWMIRPKSNGNELAATADTVRECHASFLEKGMRRKELEELLWQQFFAFPTQWWDNRRRKETPQHPDFRHKKSKAALWLNNRHKPAWVDSQLATWDAGPPELVPAVPAQVARGRLGVREGDVEVEICRKLCEDGLITDAVDALDLLVQSGSPVDKNLYYLVLKRCKALGLGKRIHALTVDSGYEGDAFLATHLIGMYASQGWLKAALQVFSNVSTPDAYNWATIIFAYARHGEAAEAIRLYRQMLESTTVKPTDHIYVAVLKACAVGRDLVAGKEVHAHILASPRRPHIFVHTCLITMYSKCGRLEDARCVFDRVQDKNLVTWTAMIAGYAQQGMGQLALSLYSTMQQESFTLPDSVTYVCLLQACASVGVGALHQGRNLHAQIEERGILRADVTIGGSLVNMYAKCGCLEDARKVFDTLPAKNVVTWNAMFSGYVQQDMGANALKLYSGMQQEGITPPDSVAFVCLLQACASIGEGALDKGQQLHAQLEEQGLQEDVAVGNSLVNMYAKCGRLEDARRIFDRLPSRNVVTWTVMIAGYTRQERGEEALGLYSRMQQEGLTPPDSITIVCLLQACARVGVGALHQGKQLHAKIDQQGLQYDVVVSGSLVNFYAKCGSPEDARRVFDQLPGRNVVTWNAMLAGYTQQGMGQEALSLYISMQQEGVSPDSYTFVCLLHSCATAVALHLGKQLHSQIIDRGLQADVVVGSALVNMYAKCGCMSDAHQVFDSLPERTIEAWGALICGYTRQGDSEAVFHLLDKMTLNGIQPDGITFLSLLTVCSHVGLVDKGRKYFEAMRTEYGISPTAEHYTCMMDLLGRAGHLDEALHMAKTLPFSSKDVVWLTLLGACQKWTNVEIGEQAFEGAASASGKCASSFVLMSNIYASAQMWDEAKEMQLKRVKSGTWKMRGQSWWTDMGGVLRSFVIGDKEHA